MAFAPGDVVTLKSGGHSMTVVAVRDEDVDCLWGNDDGELFRQSVPAIALTIINLGNIEEAEELTDDEEGNEEEENEQDGDEGDEEEEDKHERRGERRRSKSR